MKIPTTIEMIQKMRNGEKIKCPKCKGFIIAVGNPKTTPLFKCNECGKSMRLTIKHHKLKALAYYSMMKYQF